MQSIPELMKHRRHLVEGQQLRRARRGLGDVEHINDNGLEAQQLRLSDIVVQPGSALLIVARTRARRFDKPEDSVTSDRRAADTGACLEAIEQQRG